MYGYELVKARRELRAEKRRAAVHGLQQALALDLEDLATRLDEGAMAHYSAVIRRRLVLRGLMTLGLESAAVAAAVGLDQLEFERQARAPILSNASLALAVEAEVLEALPETPEPGRFKPVRA